MYNKYAHIKYIHVGYMDDLVIISSTVEENIERLKIVLRTSANHGLKINWKKCQFLKMKLITWDIESNTIN